MVLLVLGGLFARSVTNAAAIDPGHETDRAAVMTVNLGLSGHRDPTAARQFLAQLSERIAGLAGVTDVSLTDRIPLDLYGNRSTTVGAGIPAQEAHIDDRYFAALRIPILQGRTFTAAEVASNAPVAVVSEATARRLWPGATAVGQALVVGGEPERSTVEVVGVASEVKVRTLGERPEPFIYRPLGSAVTGMMRVVARTQQSPVVLAARLPDLLAELDPNVGAFETLTIRDHIGTMLFPFRLAAILAGLFGTVAMVLAAIGLYGVVSYLVARRGRELGVRMALGATSSDITRLVVGQGLGVVAIGAVVGLLLSVAAGRLVAAFLFGVSAADPVTLIAAPLLLGLTAGIGCLLPARRAVRLDPIKSLVSE
jgi:predicted permease